MKRIALVGIKDTDSAVEGTGGGEPNHAGKSENKRRELGI